MLALARQLRLIDYLDSDKTATSLFFLAQEDLEPQVSVLAGEGGEGRRGATADGSDADGTSCFPGGRR